MKLLILIGLACVAVSWVHARQYSDKFDHINVEEILESDRLLKSYVDCLMDRGRCTPDAKELKTTLPDALQKDCSECTDKQKENADKVIRYLVNNRPEMWKDLATKYDPDNIYQEKYKNKINAVKIGQ